MYLSKSLLIMNETPWKTGLSSASNPNICPKTGTFHICFGGGDQQSVWSPVSPCFPPWLLQSKVTQEQPGCPQGLRNLTSGHLGHWEGCALQKRHSPGPRANRCTAPKGKETSVSPPWLPESCHPEFTGLGRIPVPAS